MCNKRIFTIALILLLGGLLLPCQSLAGELKIWSVWSDGGTGTCTAVRGPNGTVVLLDLTGSRYQALALYNDILEPNGIRYIHYTVAGHYDRDHIGGFDDLHRTMGGDTAFGTYYDRGGTFMGDGGAISSSYYDIVNPSGKRATPSLDGSSDIDLGNGAVLRFLSMGAPDTTPELYIRGRDSIYSKTENNKSISVLITYGGFDFYFGSDLEGSGEKAVDDVITVDMGRKVDILTVDHHGSETNSTSSLEFFQTMDPEFAIISVGSNGFGHPRKTVVERLQQVVEPFPQRIIRLAPGDEGDASWAPENMDYCFTSNRHLLITTNGTTYTVDTVDRDGGNDITEGGLTYHPADEESNIPTPMPALEGFTVWVNKSIFRGGDTLTVNVYTRRTLVDWDGYLVFIGNTGVHSIVGNRLVPGVRPLARNMMQFSNPYYAEGIFSTTVPAGITGDYELVSAVLPTGSAPTRDNAQGPLGQMATTTFQVQN